LADMFASRELFQDMNGLDAATWNNLEATVWSNGPVHRRSHAFRLGQCGPGSNNVSFSTS